jgi:hypothetical protein
MEINDKFKTVSSFCKERLPLTHADRNRYMLIDVCALVSRGVSNKISPTLTFKRPIINALEEPISYTKEVLMVFKHE